MKHENNFLWFDFLRGIAAILVVLGHLRALTFVGFEKTKTDLGGRVFFFITGFGHEAVIIFFVLSGFFIIRSIHEAVGKQAWSAKQYGINRLTRLWLVLIPALLMTLLWDTMGLTFVPEATAYSGTIPYMPGLNPTDRLDATTFIGNLFFLQNIAVPTFGSNPALWSLANEFWYYLLFPLIYFSVIHYYAIATRTALAVIALACCYLVGKDIALYFLVWLMGGVVYVAVKYEWLKNKQLPIVVLLITITFFINLFLIRIKKYPLVANDYSLGILTTLLLSGLAFIKMRGRYFQDITAYLSNISYTVYLMHLSFAVLLTSFFFKERMHWNYGNLGCYFLALLVIMLYCVLMYFLFERNTVMVRNYAKKILGYLP